MIKTSDGISTKRVAGRAGDKNPILGVKRERATYTAVGGETSIDLSALIPSISYHPGIAQITVKRSSGGAGISGVDFYELTAASIGFPITDPLLPGEIVEITKEVSVTGIMAASGRPDCFSSTALAGQTLISADFSWPYNINGSKGIGGVKVYINGILQRRGVDYTEVNSGSGHTNEVTLIDALAGGENIILEPAYQALDVSAASTSYNGQQISSIQNILNRGTQAFVDENNLIPVPSTSIVNRTYIPNLANNLRASMGIERISISEIFEIQGESGASGEKVWGVDGDDRGLIRFVGNWINTFDAQGFVPRKPAGYAGYIEVTFYGTGLNMLIAGLSGSSLSVVASVDGGSDTANLIPTGSATYALSGRQYVSNVVYPVVSGLSLGIHTVRIKPESSNSYRFSGLEILNASSSVQVNPGSAYIGGKKYEAIATQSFPYASGVTGTRGGRQVVYMNSDGTIGRVFRAVDSVARTLTSTDHSNEELVRSYHPREFGAGRSDDFSSLASTSSNRAFTLDDGTTTLVAQGGRMDTVNGIEGLAAHDGTTNFVTVTFVGTGLDLVLNNNATATNAMSIWIDGGATAGTITPGANFHGIVKVASGLPYGTHSIRFQNNNAGTNTPWITRINVYGPKKPSIPQEAVELADYCVMANYSPIASPSAAPATGVLRKPITREAQLIGAWSAGAVDAMHASGINVNTTVASSYIEYTFFGTGIDYRWYQTTTAISCAFTIDGNSNLSGYTTALTYGGGLTWTPSTGILSGTGTTSSVYGASLSIRGLPLGLHTIRVVVGSTSASFYADAFDVITPIHSPVGKRNSTQNTSTVGSCSIADKRSTSMIKNANKKKVISKAKGMVLAPSTSSTVLVPVPDLSTVVLSEGGSFLLGYSMSVFSVSGTNQVASGCIYVNGVAVTTPKHAQCSSSTGVYSVISDSVPVYLDKGAHKVEIMWNISSGSGSISCVADFRNMFAMEQ